MRESGEATRKLKWNQKSYLENYFAHFLCREIALYFLLEENFKVIPKGFRQENEDFSTRQTMAENFSMFWRRIDFVGVGFMLVCVNQLWDILECGKFPKHRLLHFSVLLFWTFFGGFCSWNYLSVCWWGVMFLTVKKQKGWASINFLWTFWDTFHSVLSWDRIPYLVSSLSVRELLTTTNSGNFLNWLILHFKAIEKTIQIPLRLGILAILITLTLTAKLECLLPPKTTAVQNRIFEGLPKLQDLYFWK